MEKLKALCAFFKNDPPYKRVFPNEMCTMTGYC